MPIFEDAPRRDNYTPFGRFVGYLLLACIAVLAVMGTVKVGLVLFN